MAYDGVREVFERRAVKLGHFYLLEVRAQQSLDELMPAVAPSRVWPHDLTLGRSRGGDDAGQLRRRPRYSQGAPCLAVRAIRQSLPAPSGGRRVGKGGRRS